MLNPRPVIMLIVAIGLVGCASGRTAGRKTTETLVKQVGETRTALSSANEYVQSTLANYNRIVDNEAGDLNKAYSSLSKEIDKTQSRADDVTKRVDTMNKTATGLFNDWEKAIAKMDTESVKQQATATMQATRQKWDAMLASLRKIKELYEPFMKDFEDQVTALGFNLTPTGAAGMKSSAAKLNADLKKLDAGVQEIIRKADDYTGSVTTPTQ